jgi:hypothetical protein
MRARGNPVFCFLFPSFRLSALSKPTAWWIAIYKLLSPLFSIPPNPSKYAVFRELLADGSLACESFCAVLLRLFSSYWAEFGQGSTRYSLRILTQNRSSF